MPFKVRMRLVGFGGDAEKFPCHFEYKIGDEFIYDGEKFMGRICPWILPHVFPYLHAIHIAGNKYAERITFRYYRPKEDDPEFPLREKKGGLPPYTEKQRAWSYACPDMRTQAFFIIEPFGLVDVPGAEFAPQYNREMYILEKVKEEPGLTADQILTKFSEQERGVLHPTFMQVMLDELVDTDYIEIRDGKVYPTKLLLKDWSNLEKTFPLPLVRES